MVPSGALDASARQAGRRVVESFEQFSIVRIGVSLSCGREYVGHRVEHAALSLQDDERGQRLGVGAAGRFTKMQRNRPVRAIHDTANEGQLLPLGSDGHVERQLLFDDRIRALLKRNRRREIAGRRVDDRDVARGQQRIAMIRTQPVFLDAQGLEVRVQRSCVITHRVIEIGQVVQIGDQIRAVGTHDRLPDGEGAPVVGFGRRKVASIFGGDAEVHERGRHAVRIKFPQPLAEGQRPLEGIERALIALHVVHAAQAAQRLGVLNAVGEADLFENRQLAAKDLSRLLEIPRVLAQRLERCQAAHEQQVIGAERALDDLEARPNQRFGFQAITRELVDPRESRPDDRRCRVLVAQSGVQDREGALIQRFRSRHVPLIQIDVGQLSGDVPDLSIVRSAGVFGDRQRLFKERRRRGEIVLLGSSCSNACAACVRPARERSAAVAACRLSTRIA